MAKKRGRITGASPGQISKFEIWLKDQGASVLSDNMEWELVRFRGANDGTIFRKNNGQGIYFCGTYSKHAWNCFISSRSWNGRVKRGERGSRGVNLIKELISRDGDDCFYCGEDMPDDDMSIEHLISITCGGGNHLSNLSLAHKACNVMAGNMTVVEKVRLREKLHNQLVKKRIEI